MVAHGLASSGLFSLANSIYESTKTRRVIISKGIIYLAPTMSLWLFIILARNIGAPPSINLTAEIYMLSNILNKSLVAYIPIILASFYAAVYSLLLYTNTQHGQRPEFTNPLSISSLYWQSSALLHTLPIAFFLMKPDLLSI